MSGGLSDLRDAVVSTLQTLLPAAISVEPHGGTFDLEELKRIALTAPAVRIAVVGAHHDKRWKDGRWAVPVHLAAVIVTRDTVKAGAKLSRDAAALILSTAVQIAIAGNRFGLEGVYPPDGVDARNEYSGSVDKLGVALWQVTWSSTMLIRPNTLKTRPCRQTLASTSR